MKAHRKSIVEDRGFLFLPFFIFDDDWFMRIGQCASYIMAVLPDPFIDKVPGFRKTGNKPFSFSKELVVQAYPCLLPGL